MSQTENTNPVETGKVLGSIFGSLIIFFAVLFFLGVFYFQTLPQWAAERSFILMLSVGAFIVIIGTELGRVLFKSGVTVVGFFGLLALNLVMVVLSLAVYVDAVIPTATTTIQWVLILLVGAIAWYFILILLMVRERRRG